MQLKDRLCEVKSANEKEKWCSEEEIREYWGTETGVRKGEEIEFNLLLWLVFMIWETLSVPICIEGVFLCKTCIY